MRIRHTETERATAVRLYAMGKTLAEVRQATGISESRVYDLVKERGLLRQRYVTLDEYIERCPRPITGCWLWSGSMTGTGYGQFKGRPAHRAVYEHLVGPIPEGLQLDHLCRVTRCVNPAHLEPVTPSVNVRRGTSPAAKRAAQTHCHRGHEFTAENTHTNKHGWRECRTCRVQKSPSRPPRSSRRRGVWTPCQVVGCTDKRKTAKGLCPRHYRRWTTASRPELLQFMQDQAKRDTLLLLEIELSDETDEPGAA